jgi:ribosomal-protein-alanine N-acetyltransferase
MRIELSPCIIRSWEARDAASLAAHANNRKVWRNLRDRFPHPYTPQDAEAWIHLARAAVPETHFALAVGEEAIGGIGLELQTDVARRSAEIGYWVGEAYWGRGIATAAVRALTAFAAWIRKERYPL